MRKSILFCMVFLVAIVSVSAATIHLNAGESFEAAAESLQPGDTLIIHEGTYSGDGRVSIGVQGTVDLPVVITSADGENRPHITRTNLDSGQNTINVEGATHLTIKGLEISSNVGDGINLNANPSYITIEDNIIHNVDVGINWRSNMNNIIVRYNEIYDTGIDGSYTGEGMYVGCNDATCIVYDSIIEFNHIHNTDQTSQGDGIEIKKGSHSNIVRHNVIHDTRYPCILFYGTDGQPQNIIEGNVMWNCGIDSVIQGAADAIVRNNLFFVEDNAGVTSFTSQDHQGSTPTNLQIVHNTIIARDGYPCLRFSNWANKQNMVFANNAVYCNSNDFTISDLTGVTVKGNVFIPTTSSFPSDGYILGRSIAQDFIDTAIYNAYPSSDSPLIDAADPAYTVTNDFNGNTRSGTPDVGAYDYSTTSNPGWAIQAGFKVLGEQCIPQPEVCNGVDDNCDGQIDEGCPVPFCGDGTVNQPSEECDDGNNEDGDGCSSSCLIETSISGGDVNNDGKVDLFDLVQVARHFGTTNSLGDANNDGQVNIQDLALVATNYGQTVGSRESHAYTFLYGRDIFTIYSEPDRLSFTNKKGVEYDVDLPLLLEDEDIACDNDFFGVEFNHNSRVLQLTDVSSIDNTITVVDMGTGEGSEYSYSSVDMEATLTFDGASYLITVTDETKGCIELTDITADASDTSVDFWNENEDMVISIIGDTITINDLWATDVYTLVLSSSGFTYDPNDPLWVDERFCYTGPLQDPYHVLNTQLEGICHEGMESYVNGAWSGACADEQLPETELCGTLEDEDCDGIVDEVDCTVVPICGDGIVNRVEEVCDDGNQNRGDGCSGCLLEENCIGLGTCSWDLSDFPQNMIKADYFDGLLVVGDNAPADDVIAVSDIAMSMQFYGSREQDGTIILSRINVDPTKLASEITDPEAQNLILVGRPTTWGGAQANPLLDTYSIFPLQPGEGWIALRNNGQYKTVIVTGREIADVRMASRLLAENMGILPAGTEQCILIRDSAPTFVPCGSTNQEFIVNPSTYESIIEGGSLVAGDTVLLEPGTYPAAPLSIRNIHGEPGKYITIKSQDINNKARIIPGAPGVTNVIHMGPASYVRLEGLEFDGLGANNGYSFAISTDDWTHHIQVVDNYFHDFGDTDNGNVMISTKGDAWNWEIQRNIFDVSGLAMYLGNSDGTVPFVNGLIEHNLFMRTRGYNFQIKHQSSDGSHADFPDNPITVIRHNVFSKDSSSNGGGDARPNLLLGHGDATGNRYEVYGNFFYDNPTEALMQAEGNLAIHHNVFVNPNNDALNVQAHNGVPRQVDIFANTVVATGGGLRVSGADSNYEQKVIGNLIFAGTPISGGTLENNIIGTYADAGTRLANPYGLPGAIDVVPLTHMGTGAVWGIDQFSMYTDYSLDFNGAPHHDMLRGAYSSEISNSGWQLALQKKPRVLNPLITRLASGTWYEVQNSDMSQVADRCSEWPSGSCTLNGVGVTGVMSVWNGGAFDTKRNRLMVWGGGHSAYSGNEIYAFDIDTFQWERLMEPTYTVGLDTFTCDFTDKNGNPATYLHYLFDKCGFYPNQQIDISSVPDSHRTWTDTYSCYAHLKIEYCEQEPYFSMIDWQAPIVGHDYNLLQYVESIDSFVSVGNGPSYGRTPGGASYTFVYNLGTGLWDKKSPVSGGKTNAFTAYDPVSDTLFFHGKATDHYGSVWDPQTDTWTQFSGLDYDYRWPSPTAIVDTNRNRIVAIGEGMVASWNIGDSYPAQKTIHTTSGDNTAESATSMGLAYDPVRDRYTAYIGGNSVYHLDPDIWEWTVETPSGDDPGIKDNPGPYGRFRYVPDYDKFVFVDDIHENVFIYSP